MSEPFVLVESVDEPVLDAAAEHHLRAVRRLRVGAPLQAGDGRGGLVSCRLGPGEALEALAPPTRTPPPAERLTVGFALVKGDRPELVVQKLTEIGVDRIVPLRAERSVVRWDDRKVAAQHERHRRIAAEATEQCRRLHLPAVEPLGSLDDLLAGHVGGGASAVALADVDGEAPTPALRTVLVGPEGGWTEDERRQAAAAGAGSVRLGPHVLRAETAAIVAGATLLAVSGR